MKNWKSDFKDV